MFVECEVEMAIADKSFTSTDSHELKLWVQRAFKENACYRVAGLKPGSNRTLKAVIAVNTRVLPEPQWKQLEASRNPVEMRRFLESMFAGKGTCRCSGEPKLQAA